MTQFYVDLTKEFTNRYALDRFMEVTDGVYDIFRSFFIIQAKELPSQGEYQISSASERPDLYARDIYGTVAMWDLLLEYNNILWIRELELGETLLYPSLADLESLFLRLRQLSTR